MNWSKVKLIFLRELRDQLRDRRTLFTIAVLPLLLYPLLGMSFFQVSQFMREHPTRVLLIGTASLPKEPALLVDEKFAVEYCPDTEAALLQLALEPHAKPDITHEERVAQARRDIGAGRYDAVVVFPQNFATDLEKFRADLSTLRTRPRGEEFAAPHKIPEPEILTDKANDKSRIASNRLDRILQRWREGIVQQNLIETNVPVIATAPFELRSTDLAEEVSHRAAFWSKVLPFVVLIWALTGAFYPAVDLCAGEKERGTLETLLSSPAERSEIVWGKLLTIMTFSVATSLLNLFSLTITGSLIMGQLEQLGGGANPQLGSPPLFSLSWLVVGLLPVSALFSALSLAIASFARSSKEGQYYLMPLLLVTLPLMMLPMLPGADLDLGTSLIPVTGMMLLQKKILEGQYWTALTFVPPVFGVTAFGVLMAIRWAIDQFNNESVLFRESERLEVRLWLRNLLRDRDATPTVGMAVMCGVLLLLIRFFAGFFMGGAMHTWNDFATTTVIGLIAMIATPALLMTIMLTKSPRETLQLYLPQPVAIPAAVLLAVLLHPACVAFSGVISQLYPISTEVKKQLEVLEASIGQAPNLWVLLLVMAVTPAICEELAFRGLILSGLRRSGHKWGAIFGSAVLFGAVHGFLQQSIPACLVGMVLGYVALQAGSIFPAMAFHLTYNSLSMLLARRVPDWIEPYPWLARAFRFEHGQFAGYNPYLMTFFFIFSLGVLYWFRTLPFRANAEEQLQAALNRQSIAGLDNAPRRSLRSGDEALSIGSSPRG